MFTFLVLCMYVCMYVCITKDALTYVYYTLRGWVDQRIQQCIFATQQHSLCSI